MARGRAAFSFAQWQAFLLRSVGLVCQYDVVCFDEVSGISFDQKDGVNIITCRVGTSPRSTLTN